MATGRKPNPARRKNSLPHTTNFKVPNGTKEGAYIAGEMFGCYTHRTHASKPCITDITDDALVCPYCRAGVESTWRGYVPLWDRDWCLRYALINEDFFASVDAIPHRSKVMVSRAKNPISPLIIRQEEFLFRELPNTSPWRDPVCALSICLRLWEEPLLDKWFAEHPQQMLKGKPAVAAEEKPAPAATKKIKPAAVVKPFVGATSPPDTADTIAATGARIMSRLKERAAKNGTHDPE